MLKERGRKEGYLLFWPSCAPDEQRGAGGAECRCSPCGEFRGFPKYSCCSLGKIQQINGYLCLPLPAFILATSPKSSSSLNSKGKEDWIIQTQFLAPASVKIDGSGMFSRKTNNNCLVVPLTIKLWKRTTRTQRKYPWQAAYAPKPWYLFIFFKVKQCSVLVMNTPLQNDL